MKLGTLKKAAAATLVAGVLAFAPVAAANAYTPTPVSGPSVIAPGASATILFDFTPDESVTFTLIGEGVGPGSLGAVKFAVTSTSVTKTADGSGQASAVVTLPANATGTYTLNASGAVSGAAQPFVISVAGEGGTLPATGSDSSELLGLWIGGGALVLAGGAVAVAATVRRTRQEQNAA